MTGQALIEFREEYDLSQTALAQLLGVTRRQVARWEACEQGMTKQTTARLLRLVGDLTQIREAATGPCPHCGGTGKVDMPSYLVRVAPEYMPLRRQRHDKESV